MNTSSSYQPEEMSLQAMLTILRRRKWLILALTVLCTGGALGFALLQVPRYDAEAVLQFTLQAPKILKSEAIVTNLPPDESAIKSELDVMESRDLLKRVIDKLDLGKLPDFAPPPGIDPERVTAVITENLLQRLSINHAPQTYTVRVEVASGDPETSAKVANTLADEYIAFRQESRMGLNENASTWLGARLKEMKEKVHVSEQAVQKFQEEHNLIRLGGETVADKQVEEINTQLVESKAATAQAVARLKQAQDLLKKGANLDSIPEVLQSQLIQQLKVKITEVQQRRSELSARYGPKHPQMIKVNSELQDLQGRIYAEVNKIVQGIAHEVEVARIKEGSLAGSLKSIRGEMATGTRDEVQLAELMREKETNVTLYNELLARYKETSGNPDSRIQDVQVVSYAAPPLGPSWPNKKLLVMVGFSLGFGLGVVLAFVLEHLDKGFRTLKQLEKATGVTALGMVPDITEKKHPVREYVLHRPTSVFAESLRTVMTGVRFSNPDRQPKVVMVTSSIPEEGKSVFSVSLARLMAKAGGKVLLVDCDMRVPTLHKAFSAEKEICLENIIMDGKTLAEAVTVDEQSGLHFIRTSGKVTHSQELLGSEKMKAFIAAAREAYDLVILDSPPLLAIADGMVLARQADTAILLARWESTPRETTLTALKSLKVAQAPIAGVVLNRVNISKFERNYYNEGGVAYGKYHQYYKN